MRYLGNKTKLAKYIRPFLERHINNGNSYIEPFVGAAGMISQITFPYELDEIDTYRKYGYDNDKYIIALLRALQEGWVPPQDLTYNDYLDIKAEPEQFYPPLVGFLGYGCSFGGKWFAGLARGGQNSNGVARDHIQESRRNVIELSDKLCNIHFEHADYKHSFNYKLDTGDVYYCDPPYGYGQDVTKFKTAFDSEAFFEWARLVSERNYVYISEYSAPSDFICIWERDHKIGIHHKHKQHITKVEKLFIHKRGLAMKSIIGEV
jgi:DNA adenine methylase